jgi:hemin uptake protein HemP
LINPTRVQAERKVDRGQSTLAGTRVISVAGHKIESRDLFIGTREVMINHGAEIYRLRLTKQNKLILTK